MGDKIWIISIEKDKYLEKRLKVPKSILKKVYDCTLSYDDFILYHLEDKIPTSCLEKRDRMLVEKFGIDRCKKINWKFVRNLKYHNIDGFELLLSIDANVDDINIELYKLVKDKISPYDYCDEMKELYPDRLFEIPEDDDYFRKDILIRFNLGETTIPQLISRWDIFKDKDLSYCLLKDENNTSHITDSELKDFMANYEWLLEILFNNGFVTSKILYSLIDEFKDLKTDAEKDEHIKKYVDMILDKSCDEHGNYNQEMELSNEDFKMLFKYTSYRDYLKRFSAYLTLDRLFEELDSLPENFIFDMHIPFHVLLNHQVLHFIDEFGLKNVVDFDNECGHFFTENDCEMLRVINDMYINQGNEYFYKDCIEDENGKYVKLPYTKDEFYAAMKKMIMHGPTNFEYSDMAPDYRNMTGEFKRRNPSLFISDDAPEELKKLFYTKSITPRTISEHPEYVKFLRGKDLSACFERREVKFGSNMGYQNLYTFLGSISSLEEAMDFIAEYCDVLEIVYKRYIHYDLFFTNEDNIDSVRDKFNEMLVENIIKYNSPYPKKIPNSFREKYPSYFISDAAPLDLKEAFYNRKITPDFIREHPSYIEFLKDVDLCLLYEYMPVNKNRYSYNWIELDEEPCINIVEGIKQVFGDEEAFEVMLIYGKYLDKTYKYGRLYGFSFKKDFSKDELLDEMDNAILSAILSGGIKYDEDIPTHFKNNNPDLFLDKNLPEDIRRKFYNREYTLEDFNDNPELIDMFGNTNIALGFPQSFSWVIKLFSGEKDVKLANQNRLKIISAYSKIGDEYLRNTFIRYVVKHSDELNSDKIDCIAEVLTRLEYSNSIELSSFRDRLAIQLLETDNPIESLKKIEAIFLKNDLPLCGKMFLCFQILYPDLSETNFFNFDSTSRVSPTLKDESLPDVGFHATAGEKRKIIIFNDLLRISYRSGEKSLVDYLDDIECGNKIYLKLQENDFDLSILSDEEKEKLEIFVSHLEILYKNTKKGKDDDTNFDELSLDEKLEILSNEFKETNRYELKDRIVRSFCYEAGIKSFDELKQLIVESTKEQKERTDRFLEEMEENDGVFRFREGDFVRGIGYLDSLSGSLGTGNFCKEHLGVFLGTSSSDTTPLDVDLTMVTETKSIYHAIADTPTGFGFGNIYVVLRKDNPNLYVSRDKDGNNTDAPYDPRKIEVFGTHVGDSGFETHWGARTGISLADIDCIIFKERRKINPDKPYDENGNVNYIEEYDSYGNPISYRDELEAIKFEIVRNGYYTPVVDFSGKLIFTKEEFNNLRRKMQGLSYYHENSYELSEDLITPDVLEIASTLPDEAHEDTIYKRGKINEIIKEVLAELGIDIKYKLGNDLSNKTAEFIDTGSTGRGTNVPYDGDFDFYMRLDREIIKNPQLLNMLKDKLKEKLGDKMEDCIITGKGDLRLKKVNIDGGTIVDIDISFGVKTNKVRYSSDECLRDRLATIKRLYPDKYKYVVANIILAKKVLKDPNVNAYKPRRTDEEQGGIGGIGVENWILQNGGSFVQACKSFLAASKDENGCIVPFEEFKKKYQIWDFGENHFAVRDGRYPHDNFIENNMNETGYKKMVSALEEYLKKLENVDVDDNIKEL